MFCFGSVITICEVFVLLQYIFELFLNWLSTEVCIAIKLVVLLVLLMKMLRAGPHFRLRPSPLLSTDIIHTLASMCVSFVHVPPFDKNTIHKYTGLCISPKHNQGLFLKKLIMAITRLIA